jgi:hypothetical protein
MMLVDGMGKHSEKKFLFRIVNKGVMPTTITNIGGRWYKNYFNLIRNKSDTAFIVANPYLTQPIPYQLSTGQEWHGGMNQAEFLKEHDTGYVVFEIYHALADKPIKRRLKIKEVLKRA